jgi:serine/threonine protein kinase
LDSDSACLDHDTLAALIAGELLLDDHPAIEAHLAECSFCQQVVAAAAACFESTRSAGADESSALPQPGDIMAGKYTIENVLGIGGMGIVFAARHGALGQRFAIKVLHSTASTASARFLREARISAGLLSDHNARVFDLGHTPDGAPFLVMEYLEGEDLAQVLRRGPLAPALVISYALQICAALEEAHAAGIVHRDLKPSNVFVTRRADGSACLKVLDYGISKRLVPVIDEVSHSLTERHSLLGSPAYMSPEQLRESKDVDARADIWSVGVLLYELSTGQRPFQATVLSALSVSIATDTPRAPSRLNPAVSAGLERAIMRCLSKDAAARFGSAPELAAALRRCAAQRSPSSWRRHSAPLFALAFATAGSRLILPSDQHDNDGTRASVVASLGLPAPVAPQHVRVACDPPLAPGRLRWVSHPGIVGVALENSWELHAVCNTALALPESMLQASTSLELSSFTLVPRHPFYEVEVRAATANPTVHVLRKPTATIQLRLTGAPCQRIDSVEITPEGLGATRFEVSARRVASEGASCKLAVPLAFEAFGRKLQFRLQPAMFQAADIAFSSSVLDLTVQHRSASPRAERRPKPCVPPRYCRN